MPYGLVTTPGCGIRRRMAYSVHVARCINICKSDTQIESTTLVGNHFECMVGIVR
jgi:hypothetical protein